MSDAGRKMDVEDVLSSIRRLVSEEARTVPNNIPPEIEPVESVSMPKPSVEPIVELPEKLVLTPEFRVKEPIPETSIDADAAEIEAQIADFEAAQENTTPTPAFDVPEDTPIAEAPFENVIQPDTSEPEAELVEVEIMVEVEVEQTTPEIITPTEPKPELSTSIEKEVEIEIEALKTEIKDDVRAIEVEAVAPPPFAPVYGHEEVDFTSEVDADTYVDEEALREIVSEMVRSELQGELGDRITRNVRKLVRREIHRALASREFE